MGKKKKGKKIGMNISLNRSKVGGVSKISNNKVSNKKATAEMWWIIAAAVIALVAVMVILLYFTGGTNKLFGALGDKIDDLGDSDKDNVANMFDKCPDTPPNAIVDDKGCPGVASNK